MRLSSRDLFQSVRSAGGLLPPDLLQRVADGDSELDGLDPVSYHLNPNERLNERINRSWNRLVAAWSALSIEREKLKEGESGAKLTRELWQLPLFEELGYGRLIQQKGLEVDGKSFPVFTEWMNSPIHIVGCNTPLDRRSHGVTGAATQSPHSLVQDLLNRSDERLWGMVCNGLQLRLLRDNVTMTRQAFVEFDLEAMFEGEAYSDFALLWLVCHQSRIEGEPVEECWLEKWVEEAANHGTRALDEMQSGVGKAITELGTGFLSHAGNEALRNALDDGSLSSDDYYRQLLRLVYRLLFLFVSEDRDVLLNSEAEKTEKDRYTEFYSTRRLRQLAGKRRGSRHHDLYEQLKLVTGCLYQDGLPALGLPPLGSLLWEPNGVRDVSNAFLSNERLLQAVRELSYVDQDSVLLPVDFRNLGTQELGSIYESLLDLHPEVDTVNWRFGLRSATGNERQSTGAYYTPDSLIALLLNSTLDPLLDRAEEEKDPEQALLSLRVCDPACGSGHFLIAAAHRIAKRVAAVRSGESEPALSDEREALRDVIERCVYGVDINPMAAELCKVSLWLEAMNPGQPLTFLDSHIRVGHSLLGTTIKLVQEDIPQKAYDNLPGDDPKTLQDLKKINKQEQGGQLTIGEDVDSLAVEFAEWATDLEAGSSVETVEQAQERAKRQTEFEASDLARRLHTAADAWVGAFVAPRSTERPTFTTAGIRQLAASASEEEQAEVQRRLEGYQPFHWELEFPAVFADGGFDAIVGNPPWGRVKLQDKRFFAVPAPEIADAPNKAVRSRMIAGLVDEDPKLLQAYEEESRRYKALSLFYHQSKRFPLSGVGDVDTYALFSELGRFLVHDQGRVGLIVKSELVTGDTTKQFFADLVDTHQLGSVFAFENEELVFPAVDHKTKFCIVSLDCRGSGGESIELSFFNRNVTTVREPGRMVVLEPKDIALVNPNTKTCPVFRSDRDAKIATHLHQRFPVLVAKDESQSNPWRVALQRQFDMSGDSGLFEEGRALEEAGAVREKIGLRRSKEEYLPLVEGKMVWLWNPRAGTYSGQTLAQSREGVVPRVSLKQLQDPLFFPDPKYWVSRLKLEDVWKGTRDWAVAWRDVGPAERTLVVSVVPKVPTGHPLPIMHIGDDQEGKGLCLASALSSLLLDYAARCKAASGRMMFYVVEQLPVPGPEEFQVPTPWSPETTLRDWVTERALELTYTFEALEPMARDLGYEGPPFGWDEGKRRELQAELEACFFIMSDLERDDVEHVIDSFRVLRENEEKEHGEFLTKRLVLEKYDEFQSHSG